MTPINYQDPPPATINFTDGHNASMIATFLNLHNNKGDQEFFLHWFSSHDEQSIYLRNVKLLFKSMTMDHGYTLQYRNDSFKIRLILYFHFQ